MSEILAEGRVLVVPDTSRFRAELEARLAAIRVAPITVPVIAASAGLATTAALTNTVAEAQVVAEGTTLGLAEAAGVETAALGKQAVVLDVVTAATERQAAAQEVAAAASKSSVGNLLGASSASSKLNAALLGLRTAIGSSAVIGLGALSLGAIAAGAALAASIKNFAAFQQELATFRVTAGASADEMREVSAAAVALGEDVKLPAVSSSDAAIAMTELAKAGLSVQDAIEGARGVLELATAAQISNAEAAKIAANALNSFGLAGDQATRVADDFANAANAAQGSISDIGVAFGQASAVARQVGLSLEDTTALLSLFAKNGLQGSDAGTSLRVALIKLVAPTAKAAEEIRKLGLNIRDASGNVRADVFVQFGEATKNLTPAARDAAAALIFGQDAIRAVSIGAREGAEGLRLMQFQIDQQGTAAEVAGARTEGLAGQFSALQSNMQTLATEFGSLLSVPLTPFLQSINTAISQINKLGAALLGLKDIKIPPIHIPISVDVPGGGVPGADIAGSIAKQVAGAIPIAGPVIQVANLAKDIENLASGADKTKERIAALNFEMQKLQDARISAERGGQHGLADQLTKEINALREEIKRLNSEGDKIPASVTDHLQETLGALREARAAAAATGQETLVAQLTRQITALQNQIPIIQQTEGNITRLRDDTLELRNSMKDAASGTDTLTSALDRLAAQATVTDDHLQKLQAEGASPAAQIATLRQSNVEQNRIIAEAEKGGRQAGDITTIRKARAKIISNNAQIETLQGGIVSDQKAAAASAKTAATDAQKARDAQFQSLADIFGGRQQNIEDALSRAGIKGNITQQIRLNKALLASFIKERKALLERLKTLKVSGALRKSILAAIDSAIEQIKQDGIRFQQDQKKNAQESQQNIRDATQGHLEAALAIAETTTRTTDDVKAQRALIAFDKAQIARINAIKKRRKLTLDEKAQLDAYRVDLAQRSKAIGDLKGEVDNAAQKFRELTFSFLQTQQGFAANLLGNLIPSGALGGLVGGTTAGGTPSTDKRFSPEAGVTTQAAVSKGEAWARGDVQSQIGILRQILSVLETGHRQTKHPEARQQRRVGAAVMDTMGTAHGA